MTFILLLLMASADVASIKAQPDLERRSDLALTAADQEIDTARQSYKAGETKKMQESLGQVRELVTIAFDSLEQAPHQARKSKYYKRAELKTRAIARRLKGFAEEVDLDDRKAIEELSEKVHEIHDHLLEDIMSNKK